MNRPYISQPAPGQTGTSSPAIRRAGSTIRALYGFILGPDHASFELEQRLFSWVMFLSAIACLLACAENVILASNFLLQIGTIVAGVLFVLFLVLARRGISYLKLVYPATATLVGVLLFVWACNAGSRGGTQFYLLICPLVFMVFARGAGRIITMGIFLIATAFLLALEHTHPGLIMGYASETDRLVDISISFYMAMILTVAFVLVLHKGYRRVIEKSEAEKRASDARFFETADMLPVMICETGSDLSISFINRAGCALTGFAQGELGRAHTMLDIIHADDRPRAESEFTRTLSGERLPLQEFRIVRKDGKTLRTLLQCDHVYADKGVSGLRMCIVDITEKKSLEEQYRQAQKMESVGLLAGGVAHDFNNILSAILGYASLIRMENSEREKNGFTAKLDEQITAILKAGDRATDLVRKLLAFSRQGSYKVNPLNIHTLIDEATALLAHSIDRRITIAKHLTALNPVVSGDQSLLQSALLNLAVNARDAMPDGGTLTFSTTAVMVDKQFADKRPFAIALGHYVAVTVADTGVGLDGNVKKHLFEPFFTTKEPGKGTGLGLASVFGTVKRHGGFIEAESAPGRGTIMTFYLPQTAAQPALEAAAPPLEKPKNSLHVLVVDDETMICDFVKEYLSAEGYHATTFSDPQKAVEWYRRSFAGVDCIVLDMNMPVMDGKACFAAMRKINPRARAIFSTGFMVGDTAAIIRMPGIRGYVQKPFTLEGLVLAITQAVDGEDINSADS